MFRLELAFTRAGLCPWYIALFGGGGKAASVKNGSCDATVWEFQLFQGYRPPMFGPWSVWCRHLIGWFCVSWYIELFGAGESGPDRERTPELNCLEIPVISGTPPLSFGSWSVWCRHLLGRACVSWYIALLGGRGGNRPLSRTGTETRLSGNSS